MKKITAILLILTVLLGAFCACSKEEKSENTEGRYDNQPNIDWYNFEEYELRAKIKNIEKINISDELSAACETYKFSYYSDRYLVKAFISIPVGCVEDRTPYNCIVYNRGGNSNMGWLTGEEIATICAATERVVIGSQYRGADDSEGVDEFGGADVQDVTTILDLCENELRFINMENLCMAGVSRGGMMSYMAARTDERVKGIVAVSAVTDLAAAYNEREEMREILSDSIGGTPEELPEEYEKRSAVFWADEIKAPVLIIHSIGDELVSFSQAEAMDEELKDSGYGCTMIIHDDNVHGLHKNDVQQIVDWLNMALPKTEK